MPTSRLPLGELDVGMAFSPDDSPEYIDDDQRDCAGDALVRQGEVAARTR